MIPNQAIPETMSDGSPLPPSPPARAARQDTVPVGALAMPDEREQMTPPEVGDEVSYQVTGRVTAINGELATIERATVNGQEIGGETLADEESLMAAEAARMDGQ